MPYMKHLPSDTFPFRRASFLPFLFAALRLCAQPVAILDDPTLPDYNSALLQALHQAVRDAGMEPRPIPADEG